MRKKLFTALAVMLCTGMAAYAQNASAGASQRLVIELTNAIEISFSSTGSATGSTVTFPFANPTQYGSGATSPEYQLTIRSNQPFTINVKTSDKNFTYAGVVNPAPVMPVAGVVSMLITQNQSGGVVVAPFSSTSFGNIDETAKTLLTTCNNGGNQWFAVKYKASPGFSYPGGLYSIDAIYTATQM
ncbi:MAG: hypothetical protein JST82_00760 [Bacteroidetes bacterium]|nr:hypothetical protein [Bacteroidota bacterium]